MQSPYVKFAPRRCLAPRVFSGSAVLTTDSTVLFVDLAGFTALTEKLAQHGTRGTEELSEHVGAFFSNITQHVNDYDGDLLGYGGDALTITFEGEPADGIKRARLTAGNIHDLAQQMSGRTTLAGPIEIAARIGIAYGPVSSAVAVSSERHTPLHLGPTLDEAVAAESRARQGQTVVSEATPRRHNGLAGESRLEKLSEVDLDASQLQRLVHPTVGEHFERRAGAPTSHRALTAAFISYPPVAIPDVPKFQRRISRLVDLVVSQGGEVVQVSGGDKGIVAFVVFGAPIAHEDDPLRTVQAMLELRRTEREVRIGVTTGPVFATYLGSNERTFAAHFGRAVNTAARLMQQAQPNEILVDPETWSATAAYLRQRGQLRTLRLKGSADPLDVRAISGWRTKRRAAPPQPRLQLVNRYSELQRIEQCLDATSAGQAGTLSITGEAGIGKSRLTQEAVERARTRGFRALTINADDYPHTQQHRIWRSLLGQAAGLSSNPSEKEISAFLARSPLVSDTGINRLKPVLGFRSRLKVGDDATLRSIQQEIAHETYSRLITSVLAGGAATLVVLENTHLFDSGSRQLLRRLAMKAGHSLSLLVVGRETPITRTRQPSATSYGDQHAALDELEVDAAATLVDDFWHYLGGGSTPEWLPDTAISRAGGNPLLLRLAARNLQSSWSPGSPAPQLTTDDSPTKLLVERIDILPVSGLRALRVLATHPGPCSSEVVVRVLIDEQPRQDTERSLELLEESHLVRAFSSGGQLQYRVRHESLQQAAYEQMSHSRRRGLHVKMADALIDRGADAREIAWHLIDADRRDLASMWFVRAAESARAAWLLPESIKWWERVLPLLSGDDKTEAEASLLEDLLVAGEPTDALDRAEASLNQESRNGSTSSDVRAHLAAAEAAIACGAYEKVEVHAQVVLRATHQSSKRQQQRATELLVLALSERGDSAAAVALAREQVELAERSRSDINMMIAYASMGAALFFSDQFAEAEEYYLLAKQKAQTVGDAVHEIHIESDSAGCALERGDFDTCLARLGRARELAEHIGYRRMLAFNLTNEASLRTALSDPFASTCQLFAFERSMELGDLPTAAHSLQFWVLSDPELAVPDTLVRLARVCQRIGRVHVAAQIGAHLALAAAKTHVEKIYAHAVRELVGDDPGVHGPATARRLKLASVLAKANELKHKALPVSLLAALTELGSEHDATEVERGEIAMELWRLSPTESAKSAALQQVGQAFDAEPSTAVRRWLLELEAEVPVSGVALPPPVGIGEKIATPAQALEALAELESAVLSHT